MVRATLSVRWVLRPREDQFGFERTFDVDVQLGLGHGLDQGG